MDSVSNSSFDDSDKSQKFKKQASFVTPRNRKESEDLKQKRDRLRKSSKSFHQDDPRSMPILTAEQQ